MTITESPLSLVRSLKGAPLACLFVLLFSEQPLRAGGLCQSTGYSPNSITAALRLVEKTLDGWRVFHWLRGDLVTRLSGEVSIANRVTRPSIRDSSPLGVVGESGPDSWRVSPPVPQPAQFEVVVPPGLPPSRSEAKALDASLPFNSPPSGGGGKLGEVARILEASRLLFGERLHGPPSRYPDARLLLASIAEAYAQRHSLRKPARVAYTNLKRGVDPSPEYLADPCAHLPSNFLAAAGLPQPPIAEDTHSPGSPVADPLPEDDPPPEPHPSLALPVNGQASRSAAKAWEIAMEVLHAELPRHVYLVRVEGCLLECYDPGANVFTVAAPDELTRLWLQDRLASKLSNLLAGICDRAAGVRFVFQP